MVGEEREGSGIKGEAAWLHGERTRAWKGGGNGWIENETNRKQKQCATLVEVEESSRQVQSNTASAASNDDLSNQAPHVHARFAPAPAPIGE
eukprot:scaffold17815_cov112-Isochrysis_galbana.AAC.8